MTKNLYTQHDYEVVCENQSLVGKVSFKIQAQKGEMGDL